MSADRFETLLDEVLREGGRAQPRTGLESRVMARVREPGPGRLGWPARALRWRTGVALAVLLMGVVMVMQESRQGAEGKRREPAARAEARGPVQGARAGAIRNAPENVLSRRGERLHVRRAERRDSRQVALAEEAPGPKLATFGIRERSESSAGWFGSGRESDLEPVPREAAVVAAGLKAEQARPLEVRPLEIAALGAGEREGAAQ